jgi:hypothetical protein
LSEAVLHTVFVGTMFKIHREITINKLVGLRESDEAEEADEDKLRGRQATIMDSLRNKTIECRCFVCNRFFDFNNKSQKDY